MALHSVLGDGALREKRTGEHRSNGRPNENTAHAASDEMNCASDALPCLNPAATRPAVQCPRLVLPECTSPAWRRPGLPKEPANTAAVRRLSHRRKLLRRLWEAAETELSRSRRLWRSS